MFNAVRCAVRETDSVLPIPSLESFAQHLDAAHGDVNRARRRGDVLGLLPLAAAPRGGRRVYGVKAHSVTTGKLLSRMLYEVGAVELDRPSLRAAAEVVQLWPAHRSCSISVALPLTMIIAFHKPFGVLSQFTADGSKHRTLADFGFPEGVYPVGRLDAESEGLLLLSDEADLNARLLRPENAHVRVYWAQVERIPSDTALQQLQTGVTLGDRQTLPCRAYLLEPQPDIPPRDPPIRFRKNVADVWIGLELIEGKNHQVRRMTAAIGHPTLRLMRVRIGALAVRDLAPGEKRVLSPAERKKLFEA